MVRVLAAVAIIVAVVLAFLFSPIFKIKNIEFSGGQSCLSGQNQLEKYNVIGKNLVIFQSDLLTQSLKNDFLCINDLKIKKAYPSTLKIEVSAQEPVVKVEGTDLVIDGGAVVSKSANAQNLPAIFLPSSVKATEGDKISDSSTIFALEVAKDLKKTDFSLQNVRIVENADVAVYNTGGIVILFSSKKSAETQVDSLQLILGKAKIDGSKIGKIDLRFDKPVISAR